MASSADVSGWMSRDGQRNLNFSFPASSIIRFISNKNNYRVKRNIRLSKIRIQMIQIVIICISGRLILGLYSRLD